MRPFPCQWLPLIPRIKSNPFIVVKRVLHNPSPASPSLFLNTPYLCPQLSLNPTGSRTSAPGFLCVLVGPGDPLTLEHPQPPLVPHPHLAK